MSDFSFQCPICNQPIEAPSSMMGQLIDCPKCGMPIEVAKSIPDWKRPPIRHHAQPKTTIRWKARILLNILWFICWLILFAIAQPVLIALRKEMALAAVQSGNESVVPYLAGLITAVINACYLVLLLWIFSKIKRKTVQLDSAAVPASRPLPAPKSDLPKPKQSNRHNSINLAAEIEHLAVLRRQGVISEDEFKQAKARLLN